MDIITKVRTAKNKLIIMGGFALISSAAYSNYSINFLILFIALCIFADMMLEDAKYMTVDIRKTVALGVFLLLASKEPIGNFIFTILVTMLIFRIIYLLAILKYSKKDTNTKTTPNQIIDENNPIGLLPSFGLAFFFFGAFLQATNFNVPHFILGFQEFLKVIGIFIAENTVIWILILGFWFLIEFIVNRYKQSQDIVIVEGLGLGDVIVFPIFAAFLGISLFLFIFFLGCITHILQYLARYMMYKEA